MPPKLKSARLNWRGIWESYFFTGFILPAIVNSLNTNVLYYTKDEAIEDLHNVICGLYTYYSSAIYSPKSPYQTAMLLSPDNFDLLSEQALNYCNYNSTKSATDNYSPNPVFLGMEIYKSVYVGDNIIVVDKRDADLRLYYKRNKSSFSITVLPEFEPKWVIGKIYS